MVSKFYFKQYLLILIVLFISSTQFFGQEQVCGDLDENGQVSVVDALLAAQCYVYQAGCPSVSIGDVDVSFGVDRDVIQELRSGDRVPPQYLAGCQVDLREAGSLRNVEYVVVDVHSGRALQIFHPSLLDQIPVEVQLRDISGVFRGREGVDIVIGHVQDLTVRIEQNRLGREKGVRSLPCFRDTVMFSNRLF